MAYIEVDLRDLDDCDLIEELEIRKYKVIDTEEVDGFYRELYFTMQMSPQRAWDMMAKRIFEKTGQIVTKEINDKI